MEVVFDIPKPIIKHPFPKGTADLFRHKQILPPSEYAEKRFKLGSGYGEQGAFSFQGREWQRAIVDSFAEGYKTIITCGPVQVGKSVAGIDVPWTWWNDMVGGHSLIVYETDDKARDVFEERHERCIRTNLQHLWSGREDDLRRDKMILSTGVARCETANVELSTFSSDFVLLDEYAKYDHDMASQARGRQHSYRGMPGHHGILAIASSPKRVGDPLHVEINRGGVLILHYRMPCPHCKWYHELTDENIKEMPNAKGDLDHDPVRIRLENAARYECPRCHQTIMDQDRWDMIAGGVWASDNEEISTDGRITKEDSLRGKTDAVCFWFNRLVSTPSGWSFAQCLSAFFSARQSGDPKAWEIYQNEDMARFINPKTGRIADTFLLGKTQPYYQYGDRAAIPAGVVILICGIDTQDDGFYYVVRGFGRGMESWLVRHDFIHCDMNEIRYKDPKNVYECLRAGIFGIPFKRGPNHTMPITFGLIDEGGHRQREVHWFAKHVAIIKPYKGSSSATAEPLKQSANGPHMNGNTKHWSELVGSYMESDAWHLPADVGKDYLAQVTKQYTEEETDKRGKKTLRYISGGADHYRDGENLCLAAAYHLGLPEKLSNDRVLKAIDEQIRAKSAQPEAIKATINTKTEAPARPPDPFAYRDQRDRVRNWRKR